MIPSTLTVIFSFYIYILATLRSNFSNTMIDNTLFTLRFSGSETKQGLCVSFSCYSSHLFSPNSSHSFFSHHLLIKEKRTSCPFQLYFIFLGSRFRSLFQLQCFPQKLNFTVSNSSPFYSIEREVCVFLKIKVFHTQNIYVFLSICLELPYLHFGL